MGKICGEVFSGILAQNGSDFILWQTIFSQLFSKLSNIRASWNTNLDSLNNHEKLMDAGAGLELMAVIVYRRRSSSKDEENMARIFLYFFFII